MPALKHATVATESRTSTAGQTPARASKLRGQRRLSVILSDAHSSATLEAARAPGASGVYAPSKKCGIEAFKVLLLETMDGPKLPNRNRPPSLNAVLAKYRRLHHDEEPAAKQHHVQECRMCKALPRAPESDEAHGQPDEYDIDDLNRLYKEVNADRNRHLDHDEERSVFAAYSKASKKLPDLEAKLKESRNGNSEAIKTEIKKNERIKQRAESIFVFANKGLIHRSAVSWYKNNPNGAPIKDIEQWLILAVLERTLPTFNPERGRFTTHLDQWLKSSSTHVVTDGGQTVRPSTRMYEVIGRVERCEREHYTRFGTAPSDEELMAEARASKEEIARAKIPIRMVRLENGGPGSDSGFIDVLPDETFSPPEEAVNRNEAAAMARLLLCTLTRLQRRMKSSPP